MGPALVLVLINVPTIHKSVCNLLPPLVLTRMVKAHLKRSSGVLIFLGSNSALLTCESTRSWFERRLSPPVVLPKSLEGGGM